MRIITFAALSMFLVVLLPLLANSGRFLGINFHPGAGDNSPTSDSCAFCHNFGTVIQPYQLKDTCYGCHREMPQLELKPYQHLHTYNEIYNENKCKGCHLLHRSEDPKLLYEPQPEICYSCHPETRDYKSHPVISFQDNYGVEKEILGPDGRTINCASHCHELHGSDYEYLCPQEPGRQLCISCHEEFK